MRFLVLLVALVAGLASPALPASYFCCGGVPAFILTGTPTTTGTISQAIVPFTVTATYGASPVTFSVVSGTLPTGVTFNATTGVFSGTPSNSGTFANIVLGAEDSWAPAPHRTAQLPAFTLIIQSPSSPLTVSATPTTTGTVGTLMTPFTVTTTGGTGPYTYDIQSGALPSGVTLSSGGVVSGTPATDYDGTYFGIVIRSTDSAAHVGSLASYTMVVNAASPAVALTYTALTPVPYVYPSAHSSGATLTLHGLSLGQRNNTGPPSVEPDADGNSIGTMYYGATQTGSVTADWPPGYPDTPPYTLAPLTVNTFTTYPFRQQTNPNVLVRGGQWIGSVSSTGEQVHMAMYPYETVASAAPHIVTPQAWPACYDGAQSPPIYNTWVNITAAGTSGTSTIRSGASLAPISTMFVGEEVSSPAGTTGIQADTHIATLPGTPDLYTFTIDKPLTATITKMTLRGCTASYQNSAGAIFDSYGTSALTNARMDHVWDGPRTCAVQHIVGTTDPCLATETRLWLTNVRDDCIESDHNYSLTVVNSLLDGCLGSGISSDAPQSPSAFLTDTITVQGTLIRMQVKPDAANNPVDPFSTYSVPFKLGAGAPSIVFDHSIIALDGADAARAGRWTTTWTNMTTGNGNCVSNTTDAITGLTGNYILWLPSDTFPSSSVIPTPPAACFPSGHIQTGATARATWAAAKLAMQTYLTSHGVYRLSSDP